MIILTDDFSEYQSLLQPLFFERKLYMQICNTLVNKITWFLSTCILNITDQKTISSSFNHPSRVVSSDSLNMICPARLDTRLELKCNSLCTPGRVVINNHSKSSPIIRNDLRLIEMNSSHSKTAMTLLALRPLHT